MNVAHTCTQIIGTHIIHHHTLSDITWTYHIHVTCTHIKSHTITCAQLVHITLTCITCTHSTYTHHSPSHVTYMWHIHITCKQATCDKQISHVDIICTYTYMLNTHYISHTTCTYIKYAHHKRHWRSSAQVKWPFSQAKRSTSTVIDHTNSISVTWLR